MRILIAIFTCRKYASRVALQRRTWVPELLAAGYDVEVFDGDRLGVPDDYEHLIHKTRALCRYAVDNGYDHMLKIDDDGYIRVRNFAPVLADYAGRSWRAEPLPHRSELSIPFAVGGAYWLSNRAMRVVAEGDVPVHERAEDLWVGHLLHEQGITLEHLFPLYVNYDYPPDRRFADFEVACGVAEDDMLALHTSNALPVCDSAQDYINRFFRFHRRGDLQQTLRSAISAVAKEPGNAMAWNNLGVISCELGDYTNAILAAETALGIDPELQLAKDNLSQAKDCWRQNLTS